jgi:hypothetical protein
MLRAVTWEEAIAAVYRYSDLRQRLAAVPPSAKAARSSTAAIACSARRGSARASKPAPPFA